MVIGGWPISLSSRRPALEKSLRAKGCGSARSEPATRSLKEDPLSGLIYAVLVGIWAAVLLPMWLRRHDAMTEARSVDRFSTAVRVLSRRTSRSTQPERVAPVETSAKGVGAVAAAPSRRRTPTDARALLRQRRQRLLFGLLAVTALLTLLTLVGLLGWEFPVLGGVGTVGYVGHLRAEAKRSIARARRRRASARPTVRPTAAAGSAAVPAARAASAVAAPAPAVFDGAADWADDPANSGGAGEAWESVGGGLWSPVPVPLPMYVTAPPAPPRAYRPLLDDPIGDDEAAGPRLDEILRRRRAVND